ncbi:MAG: TRAP transporter substrate-binding protein [Hyphomicrobiales bacterium]|nr:TRAP transporter substrate-binding protein [Hyphomicrobiales bacterium]MCP5370809.1 TRAP transporter substrate-binding protein [Hyphomicrobiales bacterium]
MTERRLSIPALVAAGALAAVTAAGAAQAADVTFSVVGSWSSLPLYKQYEAPFWTKTLPEASGGKIAVEMTTFNQMGVKGGDVFRLLGEGVFDVGMTVADYTVGDAPELEGLDVPLIATTPEAARAAVDAARPMVADIMRDRFKAKMLAIAPYPPQIIFCKPAVKGLGDLKGLKVRGSGRMTTKLLDALGAEGVNVGFSEVPGALQRGVIDCAITGSGSGYSAGWHEVTTHVMPLPLGGWDPVVTAVNLDKWNGLPADVKALVEEQIKTKFEAPAWDTAAASLAIDLACLTGKGDCPLGKPAAMTLVSVTDADRATARKVLVETVLPDWAKRAGDAWKVRWNDSVGKVTGVQIP